jgi:hypothetical protein
VQHRMPVWPVKKLNTVTLLENKLKNSVTILNKKLEQNYFVTFLFFVELADSNPNNEAAVSVTLET